MPTVERGSRESSGKLNSEYDDAISCFKGKRYNIESQMYYTMHIIYINIIYHHTFHLQQNRLAEPIAQMQNRSLVMRKLKTKHIARKKQLKREQARCIRRLILDQHTTVNHLTRPTPIKYRCRSMKPSGVQAIIQALKRIPSPLLLTLCIPLSQQGSPLTTFSLLMRRKTIINMNYNFRK